MQARASKNFMKTNNPKSNVSNFSQHGHAHHSAITLVSKKHFQKDGKWISRPSKTEILVCVCGGKYIKTRKDQTLCIKCMYISEKVAA